MGLSIKKSKLLKTENLSDGNTFKELFSNLEKSWNDKNNSIELANKFSKQFEGKTNFEFTHDALKNKSLITYIDAPWGSGKTYFIENMLEWVLKNDVHKKYIFSSDSTEDSKPEFDIEILDAWEIYNGSNISEILSNIFKPNLQDDEIIAKIREYKNPKKGLDKKVLVKCVAKRFGGIAISLLKTTPALPIIKAAEYFAQNETEKRDDAENLAAKFDSKTEEENNSIVVKAIIETIEEKYIDNNKIIIIDNIERLSSANRLDVINKIMNWANIAGTTYIFLTNFEKIKITKEYEEDFWNKISLHETFKLENDWETYVNNYKYQYNGNRNNFIMSDFKHLLSFTKRIIPLFFTNNSDTQDIREIKKLLDNWSINLKDDMNDIELIKSFLNEIISNLSGLDKYFLINTAITLLSEEYWELWEQEINENENDNFSKEDFSNVEVDSEYNKPLFNNKMLRIQSNFFNLEIKEENGEVIFDEPDFSIETDLRKEFKKFNNFIDENSTTKFINLISDISETRKITSSDNYLKDLLIKSDNKYNKYFEFKYNNLRKIYIFNKINI